MKVLNTSYASSQSPLLENELDIHLSILKEMAQAAVSLEEFTIPLYMCSMYSLVGTHQITSKNAFYRGLWYPGGAITATPDKWVYDSPEYDLEKKIPIYETSEGRDSDRVLFRASNNKAFNILYKVFIEEMLHLQMAANLAKILGINPSFTSKNLVDKDTYAWECFGDDNTIIPYIVDLKDTKDYSDVKVKLGALNDNQIRLFLAIEQPENTAKEQLENAPKGKYFPDIKQVVEYYKAEKKLPLFGSIGHLYQTLFDFLSLHFEANTAEGSKIITLLDKILLDNDAPYPQRDLFNKQSSGHPIAEYSGFDTILFGDQAKYVIKRIAKLINAITQQGEGSNVAKQSNMLMAVAPEAQISKTALKRNYTSYDDEGKPLEASPRVAVRGGMIMDGFDTTNKDHYELFTHIQKHLMQQDDFMTWDQWHAKGNNWSEDLIKADDYEKNKHRTRLPDPIHIAAAMVRLKTGENKENPVQDKNKAEANYIKMCKVATGAIWGIIHVLNTYWSSHAKKEVQFPYPAMGGTGDRMSICWAIFGKVPDLSQGLEASERRDSDKVNHACQGFAAMNPESDEKPGENDEKPGENDCAGVAMYHTCKGSNLCRAEGGCGFVQKIGGGGNCSQSAKLVSTFAAPFMCNTGKVVYSPPANNACGGQGGCAVPISASQLYPLPPKENGELVQFGNMQLHDYKRINGKLSSEAFERLIPQATDKNKDLKYTEGYNVYDVAWDAFENVLKHRNKDMTEKDMPEKPVPNDIRLAFPPST